MPEDAGDMNILASLVYKSGGDTTIPGKGGAVVDNKGSALAWVVAGVAIVAFLGALAWGLSMQERVAALSKQVTDTETRAQEFKQQAERQVTRQAEEIQQLETQLTRLEETVATVEGGQPAAPPAGLGELMAGAVANQEGAAPSGASTEGGMQQMLKMYEGEQGKKFAQVSANAAVNMYYGDLFEQLDLPPEAEQRVREILANHLAEQIQTGAQMMARTTTPAERKQYDEDMKTALRNDLAEVLNDTGLGIYDAYQEGFQERVMRQSYDMQLGMFAPGLAQENREVVVDVLVEELRSSAEAGESPFMNQPEPGDQLDALERSRMRLSTVLDDEQMKEVDRFIGQQRAALEMFQDMMGAPKAADEQD